jgi:uncharacterized protein HemX
MSKQQSTEGRTARRSSRTPGPRTAGSLLAVMLLALVTGLGVHAAQGRQSTGHAAAHSTVASGQNPWNSTGS